MKKNYDLLRPFDPEAAKAGDLPLVASPFSTKEAADEGASPGRLACVRVEMEE